MTFPPLPPSTTLATVRSEPPPGPPFGLAGLAGLEGPLLAALGLGLEATPLPTPLADLLVMAP